jgi:hypothetical protein
VNLTFFHYYYLYYYNAENEEQNSNSVPWNSPPFNTCPINYNDPPIYRDGGRWQFYPKPLVVIFFRASGERDIYKKPLELIKRHTNPYMGWATPPTQISRRKKEKGPRGSLIYWVAMPAAPPCSMGSVGSMPPGIVISKSHFLGHLNSWHSGVAILILIEFQGSMHTSKPYLKGFEF